MSWLAVGVSASSSLAMPKSSRRTFPRGVHQDVGGLEVTVHDRTRMRIGHGPRGLQCQVTRARDVGCARRSIRRWAAIDEFEGEERASIAADTGVIQTRDVGMFERGEQVALARHASRGFGHRPAHVR